MAPEPEEERFQIRMSAGEREMLRTLANEAGESEATVVRQLTKAAFKARPKMKRPPKQTDARTAGTARAFKRLL